MKSASAVAAVVDTMAMTTRIDAQGADAARDAACTGDAFVVFASTKWT
jgi:hypothetical protein